MLNRQEDRSPSRKEIIETVEQSLRNLQLDYIDLVLINKYDPNCPIEEVIRAMTCISQSCEVLLGQTHDNMSSSTPSWWSASPTTDHCRLRRPPPLTADHCQLPTTTSNCRRQPPPPTVWDYRCIVNF